MHRTFIVALILVSTIFMLVTLPLGAASYNIERVSVSNTGVQGNWYSYFSSISDDGRYVAFASKGSNFVPGDTNGVLDTFVHDRETGQNTRVSVSSAGTQGVEGALSISSDMSADARYIAFTSSFSNLDTGDTNDSDDVFVHDMQTGNTKRVSISSSDIGGDSTSKNPTISADGRYIAFVSFSTNLVANDTNTDADIFLHDQQTGQTSRVSLTNSGNQANGDSLVPDMSADGRFIVFVSNASNLVAGDVSGAISDIFIRDRQNGTTALVSVSSNGTQAESASDTPSISADGRFVIFKSSASNLSANDTNLFHNDIFLRDRQSSTTTLVSVAPSGNSGNGDSYFSTISADGRYVVFASDSTDLVPDDTNGTMDVFVRDMQTGQTLRVSVSNTGLQGNARSPYPAISTDGRFINFESDATNLVPGDTNSVTDVFVAYNPLLPAPDPANAAPPLNYFTSVPFILTWTPLNWAMGYQVQVATANTFAASTILLDSSVTTNTPRLTNINLNNGLYFWRVRAQIDSTHWGAWSAAENFRVAA